VLRWTDFATSAGALGHRALARWAQERLSADDFLDEDGARWLSDTIAAASLAQGPTLVDLIVESIAVRGATVERA
jgi:hypothetical protein